MTRWDKLYNWLNDTRLAIAPDDWDTDEKKAIKEAQIEIIDAVFEEMERLKQRSRTHHKLVSEMGREEHFLYNEKKRMEIKAYRERKRNENKDKVSC